MLRKLYHLIALLSLLNVLVLLGAGAFFYSKGYLSADRLTRAGAALRGEQPAAAVEPAAPPADHPVAAAAPDAALEMPGDLSMRSQHEQEIALREMQRFRDEMDQRMALNNRIMLQISTRREALEREVQKFEQQQKKEAEVVDDVGFRKELEVFETLKPAVALERLLSKPDVTDAARIMLEMDSRKVAKMIEAAKTAPEKQKLQVVMERIREVSPEKYDSLTAGS